MIVIAVDVGTTSVRLAIVSFDGENAQEVSVLASHKQDISCRQDGLKFEQKSSEIWEAICNCCKKCIQGGNIDPVSIKAIAFSATCSLVVENGEEYDIIMWADHRAVKEALEITESKSRVLQQFGGICSPEFSLAKLVWLKNNDKQRFESSCGFFELPDWLVYRCIADNNNKESASPRSLCSVTCKWGFDVEAGRHCDIINSLEISQKIGQVVAEPGTISGQLSQKAAQEMGLVKNLSENKENSKEREVEIVVATSLIDAHSGMLAMLSNSTNSESQASLESTLCLLAGTSACMMLLSRTANFTRGVWGPYKNVILDGFHLLEAGQSMTGKLIEICIETHETGRRLLRDKSMYEIIGELNCEILEGKKNSGSLHILPTYHGNRSPLANARLRGGVYGLTAETKPQSLLDHYVATVESLAYETKLIVETLGTKLTRLLLSGGMMKNEFYVQTLANVLQCPVVIMGLEGVDFMVMGSSLVARHAIVANSSSKRSQLEKQIGLNNSSIEAIKYPQCASKTFEPKPETRQHHRKRYACYKDFVELSLRIDKIMNDT